MSKKLNITPTLHQATLSDENLLQNLARFYGYDMSRSCGFLSKDWAFPENGLYEGPDSKIYLEDHTRRAYIVKVNEELAGFVFIKKEGTDSKTDWDVGEFFITASFQGKGIGEQVARQIWTLHPGLWEVTVIPENTPALNFWRKTIQRFTHGDYKETIKQIDYDKAQPNRYVFQFSSPAQKKLFIKKLTSDDIVRLVDAFKKAHWDKPTELFELYLKEQQNHEREVWVAYFNEETAGYITLKWKSHYASFAQQNIPEIMDLNVLPKFRKKGIGTQLIETAETMAATKNTVVGLGVGLYAGTDGGYGSAQRLYVKRGFIPDGNGLTYAYQSTTPGRSYILDDDLILWMTKCL